MEEQNLADQEKEIWLHHYDVEKKGHLETAQWAISQGYTETEIANALGMFKSSVHRLLVYGLEPCPVSTKRKVRVRDRGLCVFCYTNPIKVTGMGAHAHHIDSPRDHSYRNLVSACTSCHGRLHRMKNHNREQYLAFVAHARKLFRYAGVDRVSVT